MDMCLPWLQGAQAGGRMGLGVQSSAESGCSPGWWKGSQLRGL